jgi:hypothetical protein
MNTTAPVKSRVPIAHIRIHQAEGETGRLVDATVSTWAATRLILDRICASSPKDGGYYKCDFRIMWSDRFVYEGRFDAAHPTASGYSGTDLAAQVRRVWEFNAGFAPGRLDQETYEHRLATLEKNHPGAGDAARKHLITYSLQEDPAAKPATIEKNDRPRIVDVPRPAPLSPAAVLAARLQTIETQITVVLADITTQLPILMATKTADRSADVAAYAKAKAQELELRKALAAVIKARQ